MTQETTGDMTPIAGGETTHGATGATGQEDPKAMRLVMLGRRLELIQGKQAQLKELAQAATEAILGLVDEPGAYDLGDGHMLVVRTKARRIDSSKVLAGYPPSTDEGNHNNALYRLTPDTKAIRATLPPQQVDQLLAPPELGVSVR